MGQPSVGSSFQLPSISPPQAFTQCQINLFGAPSLSGQAPYINNYYQTSWFPDSTTSLHPIFPSTAGPFSTLSDSEPRPFVNYTHPNPLHDPSTMSTSVEKQVSSFEHSNQIQETVSQISALTPAGPAAARAPDAAKPANKHLYTCQVPGCSAAFATASQLSYEPHIPLSFKLQVV